MPPETLFRLLFTLLLNTCLKTQEAVKLFFKKFVHIFRGTFLLKKEKECINKNSCLNHHIAHFIGGVISVPNLNVLVFDPSLRNPYQSTSKPVYRH